MGGRTGRLMRSGLPMAEGGLCSPPVAHCRASGAGPMPTDKICAPAWPLKADACRTDRRKMVSTSRIQRIRTWKVGLGEMTLIRNEMGPGLRAHPRGGSIRRCFEFGVGHDDSR